MTNQSGLATGEFLRIALLREIVQPIFKDESETKLCRTCGEPNTKETCLCDARTKIRLIISEILKAKSFEWMVNDVLVCDEHELTKYAAIGFFHSPSEQFMRLLKEAGIYNYAECGNCKEVCTPEYLSGTGNNVETLCKQCANDFYGH